MLSRQTNAYANVKKAFIVAGKMDHLLFIDIPKTYIRINLLKFYVRKLNLFV